MEKASKVAFSKECPYELVMATMTQGMYMGTWRPCLGRLARWSRCLRRRRRSSSIQLQCSSLPRKVQSDSLSSIWLLIHYFRLNFVKKSMEYLALVHSNIWYWPACVSCLCFMPFFLSCLQFVKVKKSALFLVLFWFWLPFAFPFHFPIGWY